jgi:hypothetical protein
LKTGAGSGLGLQFLERDEEILPTIIDQYMRARNHHNVGELMKKRPAECHRFGLRKTRLSKPGAGRLLAARII